MSTIDYIYRFDPTNPLAKPLPNDAESARRTLEDGNQTFARWMESYRKALPTEGEPRYVVPCNAQEVGMIRGQGEMPKQSPFGVVVGCSDARVPTGIRHVTSIDLRIRWPEEIAMLILIAFDPWGWPVSAARGFVAVSRRGPTYGTTP